MRRSLLPAVLSLSLLLSTLVAAHAASYTFTTIDGPGATQTFAYGINDRGQIVVAFNDGTRSHSVVKDGTTSPRSISLGPRTSIPSGSIIAARS
jgi:hypothetical protein